MATELRQKLRGTTAQLNSTAGLPGLLAVDLSTMSLRLFDGSLAGGYSFPNKSVNDSRYLITADIGTQNLLGGDVRAESQFSIYGPVETQRTLTLQTGTTPRIKVGLSEDPEGVYTDSGSNFVIDGYSDAGAFLGRWFRIERNVGQISMLDTAITGVLDVVGGANISGGALAVTGLTTTTTLTTTGLATLNSAQVTTTLGVTGATTLSTLGVGNTSITGTLGVTGTLTGAAISGTGYTISSPFGVYVGPFANITDTLFAVNADISGSIVAPSFAFRSDTDTGLFRLGADQLTLRTGGTDRLTMTTTTLTSTLPLTVTEVNASSHVRGASFAFAGDTDTGIFRASADTVQIATGGTTRLDLAAAASVFSGVARATQFSFTADTDTYVDAPLADTLRFVTGNTERMRIHSSGFTSVGLFSSTARGMLTVLNTPEAALPAIGAASTHFIVGGSTGFGIQQGILNTARGYVQVGRYDGSVSSGALLLQPSGNDVSIGAGNAAPLARFDVIGDSANIGIRSQTTGAGKFNLSLINSTATSTAAAFYTSTSTLAGRINTSSATTSYVTTSDVRLKENIQPAPYEEGLIDSIEVVSFDWKADGVHTKHGFIAQELHKVVPDAVYVPDETDTESDVWGVDHSKLVPVLVLELQKLRNRVGNLEQINHVGG